MENHFENSHFRQWIHAAPEENEMSKRKNTKAQIPAGLQKEKKVSQSNMMQWSSALLDNNTKTTVQDTCMVKWVIIWAHINDP